MVNVETKTYLLRGIEPLLGSNPADPDVRAKFIESRKPPQVSEDESGNTPDPRADDNNGLTVFLLHPKTGGPMIYDYVIRGYIKEALTALGSQIGMLAARTKVDRYLFAGPRHIPVLTPDGEPVREVDGIFERPLRAMTAQGPRVALAGSEQVDAWMLRVELTLIANDRTAKSCALTWDAVETALNYGRLQGLGQYRNGGFGRFTWEREGVTDA